MNNRLQNLVKKLEIKKGERLRQEKSEKTALEEKLKHIFRQIQEATEIASQKERSMPDFRKLGMGLQGQIDALGGQFVDDEVPSGTIDGSNKAFVLAYAPKSGSVKVYLNGSRRKGGGEDYTLSGRTITFGTAPRAGAVILVDYKK